MPPEIKLLAQKRESEPLDYDKQRLTALIKDLSPGCYEIEIKRAKKHKSHQQVKMIFGHMINQAVAFFDDNSIGVEAFLQYLMDNDKLKGVAIDKDYIHALMYQICPTFDDEGKRVTLSKMNTIQANDLFERFRTIMAPFGCVIADPNPNWQSEDKK